MHVAFLHLSRLRGGHGLVPPRRQKLVDHERLEAVGHWVAPVHLWAGSTEHVRLAFMQGARLQDMQLHQYICARGARFGGSEVLNCAGDHTQAMLPTACRLPRWALGVLLSGMGEPPRVGLAELSYRGGSVEVVATRTHPDPPAADVAPLNDEAVEQQRKALRQRTLVDFGGFSCTEQRSCPQSQPPPEDLH